MRMRKMWMMGIAVSLAGFAAPVAAGTLYQWTAADGTVSFTDDAKRVPERYRGEVKRIKTGGLDGYKRYTPSSHDTVTYRERLDQRIDRLEALNAPAPAAEGGNVVFEARRGSDTILQTGRGTGITIPNDPLAAEEPIIVEQKPRARRDLDDPRHGRAPGRSDPVDPEERGNEHQLGLGQLRGPDGPIVGP